MRYRFYRVHKYVCFELTEFDRAVARADFRESKDCQSILDQFKTLSQMLEHHALYEDKHIHKLLRQKQSTIQSETEHEHQSHHAAFADLEHQLQHIMSIENDDERILLGHDFYLSFRLFHSEMLKHLYDEEKILLPELQRLYMDTELAALQARTYAQMTPEQMLGMMQTIWPHANNEDKAFFLNEMKEAEPEKFEWIWAQLPDADKHLLKALPSS